MVKVIIISLFFIVSIINNCFSRDSIIEIVLKRKESIVTVYAVQSGIIKSPKISAAINPLTGKLLIARNIKKASYEKNGAGVIINETGLIITNYHIIKGAKNIIVKLHNSQMFPAKIAKINQETDLALIKIDVPFKLSSIQFSDSNKISLGDEIIHIGNSELLDKTISGGHIIGLATRNLGLDKNIELIEVNINIYKGDSGGPLLDSNGALIGMMAAKLRTKQKASFAIPSNKIKKIYLDFIK